MDSLLCRAFLKSERETNEQLDQTFTRDCCALRLNKTLLTSNQLAESATFANPLMNCYASSESGSHSWTSLIKSGLCSFEARLLLISLGSLITSTMCLTKRRKDKNPGKNSRVIRHPFSHSLLHPPPRLPEGRGASSKPCHEFLTTLSVCSYKSPVYVCATLYGHVLIK